MVTRKKKQMTSAEEKHVVRNNLCSHLKAVYFSKDDVSAKRGIDCLVELFIEIAKSSAKVRFFLDELRFRLNFLIDNKTGQTARVRCLRVIATAAVQLMKQGDVAVLDFLVDFCFNLHHAVSQVVRQYVCILVGIIYRSATLSNEEFGTMSILPDYHYRTLFGILRERWIDAEDSVRREAICALSFIQQDSVSADHEDAVERSAQDMLMMSLSDRSAECREEAVKRLLIAYGTQAQLIVGVAQRDSDVNVKRAALRAVIASNALDEVNQRTRMDLLEHLMAPAQSILQDVTSELLLHLVKTAAKNEENDDEIEIADTQCDDKSEEDTMLIGTLHFLRNFDIIGKEEVCERTLAMAFRTLAQRRSGGLVDVVSVLTESDAECLKRNNYRKLLLESGYTLAEKALILFHWRVLVELCCVEYARWEDKKSLCLFKLVPTLHTFSEFTSEFVESFAESQESPFRTNLRGNRRRLEDSRQFCLIQFMRVLQCMDREPVGMNSWKKLLFSVLGNTEVRLTKGLVCIVVDSIMYCHYPNKNDAEPALHEFCDVINSFIHADQFDSSAIQNFGHFSPSRGFVNGDAFAGPNATSLKIEMDVPTRERSLLIFNAILRSGFFKTITAEIQGLYDTIVSESFTSPIAEVRILALECLSVFAYFSEDYAKQLTCLVAQTLLIDIKAVKVTCISLLTDLVPRYGYNKVSQWYSQSNDDEQPDNMPSGQQVGDNANAEVIRNNEAGSDPQNDLIGKMIALSTGKCPELAFRATECLCKWRIAAMDGNISAWHRVLEHLQLLSIPRDEDKENSRQMACLSQFISLLTEINGADCEQRSLFKEK